MTKKGLGPNASNAKNVPNVERQPPREKTSTGPTSLDPKRGADGEPNGSSRPTFEVEGPERPGIITRSQQIAIRNLRTKGWSTDRIHNTTGLSKATVHKYTSDIVPQGVDESAQTASTPTLEHVEAMRLLRRSGASPDQIQKFTGWPLAVVNETIRDITPDQDAGIEQPSLSPSPPRLPYEINANSPPPRIVEDNNGREQEPQSRLNPIVVENNGGPSRPVSIMISPGDPALQDVIIELLHLSAARGVPFGKYLSSGMAVEDLRDAAFCKTLIVGDGQDFRTNLLATAKKANLHDRYRTDAGLDVTGVANQ
jgi:hypothetical protein